MSTQVSRSLWSTDSASRPVTLLNSSPENDADDGGRSSRAADNVGDSNKAGQGSWRDDTLMSGTVERIVDVRRHCAEGSVSSARRQPLSRPLPSGATNGTQLPSPPLDQARQGCAA